MGINKTSDSKDKFAKMKSLPKYSGPQEELYIPTVEDVKGKDFEEHYKEPDGTQIINWTNMKLYWYWINERMQIWYKRTIRNESSPWTEDKILQENKFTNAIRALDRGTIKYIKDILSKLDEPCEDIITRKKEVILNTMIYRLFLRPETCDAIGFLHLDNWDEEWEQAKERVRERKRQGLQIWHGAYYVSGLKMANPDPATNKDKTENGFCLCEMWYDKIDEIYDFVTAHNMQETIDYLVEFPCLGQFTVYEFICDWVLAPTFTNHTLVNYSIDSDVNIGPGNKMGLDFIFEDKGNLSYKECDFYLRASWEHYMQRYGYYEDFIKVLPEWMNNDIDMRVIEHDLCELQKYLNVYYGTGKCKAKFHNQEASGEHLDYLKL